MRIVYVTDSLAAGGGVETGLVSLVRELTRRGHEATVMSSGGPLTSAVIEAGGAHVRTPIRIRDPLGLLRTGLLLQRWVARRQPHIVDTMSPAGNIAAALVALRPRGTHFVTTPLGIRNAEREGRWKTELRARLHVLRSERVIIVSPAIRAAFVASGVAPARVVDGVAPWIEPSRFHVDPATPRRVRDELRLSPDMPLITTIGALHPRMSHELFIDAARQVVATGRDVVFAIAGEGIMRPELERQIVTAGLERRVRLLGHRSDIPAVLSASTVYVKPGVVEGGISTTVLEAMAARVPVIAFDTLDVRDAIEDGKTGLLVARGDATALAGAVMRMLDEPAFRSAVVDASIGVVARYSVSAAVDRLLRIYQDLAGSSSARPK